MDNLTREQRHRNMQKIRSRDTTIERILCRCIREKGYGYRKNYKELPGRPDIVLTKYRIAIFCDSEFFHGKDWETLQVKILKGDNSEYWLNKISRNIERDLQNNTELMHLGWKVLRFWGKDIRKTPDLCLLEIENAIVERISEKVE